LADDPQFIQRHRALEESILLGGTDITSGGPPELFPVWAFTASGQTSGRSRTIILESPANAARVYFKKGKIIGASTGSLEGMSALKALLETRDFRFVIFLRTYFTKKTSILLQADELLSTSNAGPDQETPFSRVVLVTGHPAAMDVFEVLSALDGIPEPVVLSLMCEEGSGEIYRDRNHILDVHIEG